MSFKPRVTRTYQKQTESYPNGFVSIIEKGNFFDEERPKMELELLQLRNNNTEIVKVSGVSFELWSKWWLSIKGYETKDGRTYERGNQINKEQLQSLIEFLQGVHDQMEQVAMYPAELPSKFL